MGGYVVSAWVKAQALDNCRSLLPGQNLQITMRNCCGSKHRRGTHVVQHRPSRSLQLQRPSGVEMEMPLWAQCFKMLPADPRMLKSHLC